MKSNRPHVSTTGHDLADALDGTFDSVAHDVRLSDGNLIACRFTGKVEAHLASGAVVPLGRLSDGRDHLIATYRAATS